MNKEDVLNEIFDNDPLNLLIVKKKNSNNKSADQRLVESFQEINDFYKKNSREPAANISSVSEYKLYSRLRNLREDNDKSKALNEFDEFNLLHEESHPSSIKKEIASIDDIFNDDSLSILESDAEEIFSFNHTPKETTMPDYVAARKSCDDFNDFESLLINCQKDLKEGMRKVREFKNEQQIEKGSFFVLKGVLLYIADIEEKKADRSGKMNARLRCIFENGTESDMLLRSLSAELYKNGRRVTENEDRANEDFIESFNSITDDDSESGYLYVLKSKSDNPQIRGIKNLYKIGFTRIEISERIKNAEKEPTYLMAPVEYVAGWKCFNLNAQKFELVVHKFFGQSCLEIDVFDQDGKRHTPREWFIAPLEVIKKAVESIIDGSIVNYAYDPVNESIVEV